MKSTKKFKLTFLFFLTLLIIFSCKNVKANSISKISMDIYVDSNGNAQITEIWNCNVTQGTESYHPYYNLGDSTISNLTVSDNSKSYTTLNSWDTSANFSEKAYKCGINEISNGVELCWGISKYGNQTYTVKYTIYNFVKSLNDAQMIYWTLIPHDFSNSIGNAYIKIYSDFKYADTTDVWGYGNYGGTCYVYDGYIEMSSDGTLDKSEYMTILAKFPQNTFNCESSINKDFQYYLDLSAQGSKTYKKSKLSILLKIIATIFNIFLEFLPVFIIALIAFFKKSSNLNFGPAGKKFSKDTPYFRDIPCNKDLFKAYYIAYEYGIISKKTDLLGAIILKWIKDSIITIEKRETGTLIKKEDTVIVLTGAKVSEITNQFENKLFTMLYEASVDGILENKEFEKWCKKSYTKILDWFDSIISEQKQSLVNEGLILKETSNNIFKRVTYTATQELREEAERIYGLKHYLLDYTLIPDRDPIEVKLFEEFLVYAQMMGIATKVAKDFKDLYPDIIEESNFSSYDNIVFINTASNRGIVAANTAKSRAESYSSGGGGFSSGGGGGGSFGGGGGGGGFR